MNFNIRYYCINVRLKKKILNVKMLRTDVTTIVAEAFSFNKILYKRNTADRRTGCLLLFIYS